MQGWTPKHSLWLLCAALVTAGPAAAQAPTVAGVFPVGGQRGYESTIKITGANLQGATRVVVSGSGVEARITSNTEGGNLPITLYSEPEAAIGPREIRVVTPNGVSTAGRVWIGGYPIAEEKEPNNTVQAPQALNALPLAISGVIGGAEDQDFFKFRASAGETLVFDLASFRLSSGLDGYLSILDARGRLIKSAVDAFDRDPRIIHTFTEPGEYCVLVRDSLYRGGSAFSYQLTAGRVPVLTSYLPRAAKRGASTQLQVDGVNLGDMKSVNVAVPSDPDAPVTVLANGYTAIDPVMLDASDLQEAVEAEPNNSAAQATLLAAVPSAVSGKMDTAGDVDTFKFKATAAGNLALEVFGRRIGSRIDSFLRVLDATGKELQSSDDAVGKDSRVTLSVTAGTEYTVQVRSLDGRAGGDAFYRLVIAPPGGQDFALTVTPDEINLPKGGSVSVTVNSTRLGGFSGEIQLSIAGMPAGLSLSRAIIPAGGNTTTFTITASGESAPGTVVPVQVQGTGTIGAGAVTRSATPIETYPIPLAPNNQTATRTMQLLYAGVMPQAGYALDVEPRAITIKRGQSNVEVKVKATRQMGVTQQIVVSAANLPGNVTAPNVNLPANQNEVVLKINAAANAALGVQNIVISGNLSNNVQTAPAITVTVTQ